MLIFTTVLRYFGVLHAVDWNEAGHVAVGANRCWNRWTFTETTAMHKTSDAFQNVGPKQITKQINTFPHLAAWIYWGSLNGLADKINVISDATPLTWDVLRRYSCVFVYLCVCVASCVVLTAPSQLNILPLCLTQHTNTHKVWLGGKGITQRWGSVQQGCDSCKNTATHFSLDSQHANQLVQVWEVRAVYSADGAYFHVYSFRNKG